MTKFYWAPDPNGDDPRGVVANSMRVNDSGALIFENEEDFFNRQPVLFIAPGEWRSAWRDEE